MSMCQQCCVSRPLMAFPDLNHSQAFGVTAAGVLSFIFLLVFVNDDNSKIKRGVKKGNVPGRS